MTTVTPTDWDSYYLKPASAARFTRRLSQRKLLSLLSGPIRDRKPASVCECGGANSCFIDGFLELPELGSYHAIDFNAYGIGLLKKRFAGDARVSWAIADLIRGAGSDRRYDVVYSVGLIEHFDPAGTARIIDAHFDLCKPGGVVLMTFPTPTLLYRAIRKAAELLGIWAFPDERPLSFDEVRRNCERHASQRLHESINWAIGLTQGYVMYRKTAN